MSTLTHLSPAPLVSKAATAVLTSGGLDSAVLLAFIARGHSDARITPIYIRAGLAWEAVELDYLHRYLREMASALPNIQPLVILEQPTRDLYGRHWSTTGESVPDADTPDEAVYLPGRNMLLMMKALLWCHLNEVKKLCLGILSSNPFPDATPEFFSHFARSVGMGVHDPLLKIDTPFSKLHKVEVVRDFGQDLPLEWSFSCIQPIDQLHCGKCNKCAERKKAFVDAGMADPTSYYDNISPKR